MKSWDVYLPLSQDTHFPHRSREAHTEDRWRLSISSTAHRLPHPSSAAEPKPSLQDAGSWCVTSRYGSCHRRDKSLFSSLGRLLVRTAKCYGLGCWYCPIDTQLCLWADTAALLLLSNLYAFEDSTGVEEQLSVRTWPGCPEAAQKLLEMLSPTPINLSVSSKISKSCCVLVVFEQLRSTNFQEHLSPSPLTGDFDLSFRQWFDCSMCAFVISCLYNHSCTIGLNVKWKQKATADAACLISSCLLLR